MGGADICEKAGMNERKRFSIPRKERKSLIVALCCSVM